MANFLRAPCDDVAIPPTSSLVLSRRCEKWVLVATILGSSIAFIDGTIVNIALPALQNIRPESYSYYIRHYEENNHLQHQNDNLSHRRGYAPGS